jgi:hypothetical protein
MKNKLHVIIALALIGSSILRANNRSIIPMESLIASTLVNALIIFLASFLVSKVVYQVLLMWGGKERKYSWKMNLTCLIILVAYLLIENNYDPFTHIERLHGYQFKEILHLITAAVLMSLGCFIGYKISPIKRLYY